MEHMIASVIASATKDEAATAAAATAAAAAAMTEAAETARLAARPSAPVPPRRGDRIRHPPDWSMPMLTGDPMAEMKAQRPDVHLADNWQVSASAGGPRGALTRAATAAEKGKELDEQEEEQQQEQEQLEEQEENPISTRNRRQST